MKAKYEVILRLCLIGGTMYIARHIAFDFFPQLASPVSSAFTQWSPNPEWSTPKDATNTIATEEWLRGEKLCTYKGKVHLAWSVPLIDTTYYVPGASLHFFLMFAPFFATKFSFTMMGQGIFLLLTGPVFTNLFTDN